MRYPNLTAEYEASGYHISTLANHANVTQELMYEILYGDEEVSYQESRTLYGLLSHFGGFEHYSMEYLFAPALSTVDPTTNRGKVKTMDLKNRLRFAYSQIGIVQREGLDVPSRWQTGEIDKAYQILQRMEAGQLVTYAEYRNSILDLDSFLGLVERPARRTAPLSLVGR